MDFLTAFSDRVQRRLREMEGEAKRDSQAIVAKMAARGLAQSGPRVQQQLDAITAQLHRAVDWALGEASRLPGHAYMTRKQALPYLTINLEQHIGQLYAYIHLAGLGEGVRKAVAEHRTGLKETLNGELKDFSEGLWHARNADVAVPQMTTHNTLNIQGPNQGTVQQAGANSNQEATFVMNTDSVAATLNQFMEALAASDVDPDTKNEMKAEVGTIQIQLKRSKPNLAVVQAAVSGLQQLALGVGANILTPYVLPLLAMVGLS